MEKKEVFSQNVPSWLEASPSLWKLCLHWGFAFKTGHYIAIEEALCRPNNPGGMGRGELILRDFLSRLEVCP